MSQRPPRLADWLLSKICRPELLEAVKGDLHEYFARNNGSVKSKLHYWFQVLNILRPQLIQSIRLSERSFGILFKYNLLFAFRNMKRQKFYTFLNVLGISVGLTCCIFISLFVLDEWSYDKHWKNKEEIYRVYVDIDFGTTQARYANATAPMADIFENEYDDVLIAARWINSPRLTFRINDALFEESNVIYADQDILEIFSMEAIHGQIENALDIPNSLVLTETTSRKYFGDQNPVDKVLTTASGTSFKVTCVIKDIQRNSHFNADILRTTINDPWSDPSKVSFLSYWTSSPYRTYLKLRPGTDPQVLVEKFESIYTKYFDPVTQAFSGQNWAEFKADGNKYSYQLQPLNEVYLYSDFQNDGLKQGDIRYLYMFSLIGLFILFMAYANFVNLTTARATQRYKEIGMKKVIGSSRIQLIKQFLLESILISVLGLVIAIGLVYLYFPTFLEITGKDLADPLFNQHQIWLYILLITIATSTLAGYYPAIILSGIPSIKALKGNSAQTSQGFSLRNFLVLFQYFIVVILVIGTVVVYLQLNFLERQDLGYSRENILVVNNAWAAGNQLDELKVSLAAMPEVSRISALRHVPGDLNFFGGMMFQANHNTQEGRVNCKRLWVDSAMIPTLDLQLITGRNFDETSLRDSMSVIITKTAVNSLGLGSEPLGKRISFTDGKNESFKVIGVVEDFHIRSLKSPLFAIALHHTPQPTRLAIKYQTSDLPLFIDKIQDKWDNFVATHVMSYQFGTDRYDRFYRSEQRMKSIVDFFVLVALFIASLGMIGLASLVTVQRKKELGVRKVLGARVEQLIWMVSKSLTQPILFAILVGIPVGWIFMNRWLEGFAYRIEIDWKLIVLSVSSTIFVASAVVISLTYRSARANPVDNLRHE